MKATHSPQPHLRMHAQVLTGLVKRAVLDAQQRAAMDEQIAIYVNGAGACERLLRTCIPMCYTRHLSRVYTPHHQGSCPRSMCNDVHTCTHSMCGSSAGKQWWWVRSIYEGVEGRSIQLVGVEMEPVWSMCAGVQPHACDCVFSAGSQC